MSGSALFAMTAEVDVRHDTGALLHQCVRIDFIIARRVSAMAIQADKGSSRLRR